MNAEREEALWKFATLEESVTSSLIPDLHAKKEPLQTLFNLLNRVLALFIKKNTAFDFQNEFHVLR